MNRRMYFFCAIVARLSPLAAGVAAALTSLAASAQTLCQVSEIQKIESPAMPPSPDFARAVDIAADTIVIGDASDGELGENAGAVHVMTFDGVKYVPTQVLRPGDGDAGDRFGASVAINGNTIIIGAPRDELPGEPKGSMLHAGWAYVFVRTAEGLWTQAAKLVAPDASHPAEFGHAVAIWANVILVGAWNDPQVGLLGGAVYVYEFDGTWALKQKLTAADGDGADQFGGAVAIDGTFLVVGAHGHGPGLSFGPGAAYIFQNTGKTWTQVQKLEPGSNAGAQSFGRSVDVSGNVIIVGSPQDVAEGTSVATGVAYVYQNDGTIWGLQQQLWPSDGMAGDEFGTALSTHNGTVAVGSPKADVEYEFIDVGDAPNAGVVYVYAANGMKFEFDHKAFADRGQFWLPDPAPLNEMGICVAINSGRVVAGSAVAAGDQTPTAATYVFDMQPPDCDANGVPDLCDPDCNHTRIPDACEVANGISGDCNRNGLPDECETTHLAYCDDQGTASFMHGSESYALDLVWLKQFTVRYGYEHITHVEHFWAGWIPDGTPITWVVYDDPNNDGDPHDALLLSATTVIGTNDFNDNQSPNIFSRYAIAPTYVGRPGESFFVGGHVQCNPPFHVAPELWNPVHWGRSWHAASLAGTGDLEDLPGMGLTEMEGKWVIRALALDCNANGTWDGCDIESGLSKDLNGNGVPDECDNPCPCDLDSTGTTVDVADLLILIASWKAVGGAADITGNGLVNVDDLLAVIEAWGTCP